MSKNINKTQLEWMMDCKDVRDCVQKLNHLPVEGEKTNLGKRMDTWLKTQFRCYKSGKLSSYRVDVLSDFLPEGWYKYSFDELNIMYFKDTKITELKEDISIRVLYEMGKLSTHEYSMFLSKNIFYLRDILKYRRHFYSATQVYEVLQNKYKLPDIRWYNLYKLVYRFALNIKEIFIKEYWDSMETLKRFPETFNQYAGEYLSQVEIAILKGIYIDEKSIDEVSADLGVSVKEINDYIKNAIKAFKNKNCIYRFTYKFVEEGCMSLYDIFIELEQGWVSDPDSIVTSDYPAVVRLSLSRSGIKEKSKLKGFIKNCKNKDEVLEKLKGFEGIGSKKAISFYGYLERDGLLPF